MMRKIILASAMLIAIPVAASAQDGAGAATGATTGAVGGAIIGGPVGAVVGGVGGAIVGGIADDHRNRRFHTYVVEEHVPSCSYDREVVVGAELPRSGVRYYEVPREYGATRYRYTVVNNRTVLVDPGTHRVVQIIE